MKHVICSSAAALALVVSGTALASDAASWPSKPIQVIVPAGAGGDTDFNARTLAMYFQKQTGKAWTVTNQGAKAGVEATNKVKAAAPDGYTILFGHTGHLVVNEVSGLVDYGFDGFEVACIPAVDKSNVLVSSKKSGIKTLADLISKAKAQPDSVIYGTELGGMSHLQGLVFQKMAGIKLKYVEAGSASAKVEALTSSKIDVSQITYGAVKDFNELGDIQILAQSNATRNPLLGNIKTFKEQGSDFAMDKPYIIAFPKGTDPAIVKKMAEIMKKITEEASYAKVLSDGFKQPVSYMNGADSVAYLRKVRTNFMQYKDLLRQK